MSCCLKLFAGIVVAFCTASSMLFAAEPATGWRGNGTGIWPDAQPPLQWHRTARGALEGLRSQADRPAGTTAGDASPVEKGLLRHWLLIGPFPVADSIKDFDRDVLGGEASAAPTAGQKVGDLAWQPATVPPDDIMVFGTAELPWLDLAKAVGFKHNQFAYAHTFLFSPRGGPARIVVEHAQGLKVWLNGRDVYRSTERGMALGYYTAISTHELNHLNQPSPRFDVSLQPGWNRLLLKLSTPSQEGFTDMQCCLRIMDPADVPYESQNILWMSELPGRSTSTPIVVGERIFLMAEPDELVCLDKATGRVLWTAASNYYAALTADERRANPAFTEHVDPLVAALRQETDRVRRIELRGRIEQTLSKIDEQRFSLHASGHFSAHFGIVGFTMPTPVSDGERIYIWLNTGVAACYDLDGQRQWISRIPAPELNYGSCPALADGVLAVFLDQLYGLDAKTGKILWRQQRIHHNVAAILAATLAGQSVFVTQRGEVIRPSDGELLFRPKGFGSGDTGWSPPQILGNTMYLPQYGVCSPRVFDFAGVSGSEWDPKLVAALGLPEEVSHRPDGSWIDRWTAGSPLVWEGLLYQTDIYQSLYAIDIAAKKMAYRQELDLHGFTHYNAVAVAASPTLIGRHIFVMDNQGTTLVLEPGRELKVVAKNRIGTVLDRPWPIPSQETLAYAPPVVDGNRIYLRGERFLYCIGN